MTSLRFAFCALALSLAACGSESGAPSGAADSAVSDAKADAPSDAREAATCVEDGGPPAGCASEDSPIGSTTVERNWSSCLTGKEYQLTCSDVGADGQRDCTCKVDGATIGTFHAVTPEAGVVGGTAWRKLFECYCGVLP